MVFSEDRFDWNYNGLSCFGQSLVRLLFERTLIISAFRKKSLPADGQFGAVLTKAGADKLSREEYTWSRDFSEPDWELG